MERILYYSETRTGEKENFTRSRVKSLRNRARDGSGILSLHSGKRIPELFIVRYLLHFDQLSHLMKKTCFADQL